MQFKKYGFSIFYHSIEVQIDSVKTNKLTLLSFSPLKRKPDQVMLTVEKCFINQYSQ